MKRVPVLIGSLAIVLTSFALGCAQEVPAVASAAPSVQQPDGPRARRMMTRRRVRRGMAGALRSLNLTDVQKQQARDIMRANFESTQAQRQRLAKLRQEFRAGTWSDDDKAKAQELRQQLHASRQNARTQLAALLTPEQKTKLDEMIKNRRENRGRFGRRGQILNRPI